MYTVTVRSKKNNLVVRVKKTVDYYEAMSYHKMVKTRYDKSFEVDFKIKTKKVS